MHGGMGGWMERWIDVCIYESYFTSVSSRVSGWDEWMKGGKYGWTEVRLDAWRDGWVDGAMD